MDKIVAFVDDAAQALQVLRPLDRPGVQWLLVGCAPKLTHRVSRWVTHSQREQWRRRWAEQLFAELRPRLPAGRVETLLARQPLDEVVHQLRLRHGRALRLVDARQARLALAAGARPVAGVETPEAAPHPWALPLALSSGLSLVLALSD